MRTIATEFHESVKVKFELAHKSLPQLTIQPALSSFNHSGGFCGLWDEDPDRDFFVLNKNGAKRFLVGDNDEDIQLITEFWK